MKNGSLYHDTYSMFVGQLILVICPFFISKDPIPISDPILTFETLKFGKIFIKYDLQL